MIHKPKLKEYLTVFPISETTWGLRGGFDEFWRIRLSDERALRALSGLLPYLNGRHEVDEILARLAEQGVEQNAVRQLLERLEEAAFIEEPGVADLDAAEMERHQSQISFFSRFTSEGGTKLQALLRDSKIGLVGSGPLALCLLRRLVDSGIGHLLILERPEAGDKGLAQAPLATLSTTEVRRLPLDYESILPRDAEESLPKVLLVPQEAHDPRLLEAVDAFSKSRNVPWMLLRVTDPHEGWVGPLFIPGETASYLSLEARLKGQMRFFDEYLAFDRHLRNGRRSSAPCGSLGAFFEQLAAIAAIELIKYITGFSVPLLAGRFLSINLMSWETEVHEVLRLPHLENQALDRPRIFPWKDIPYDEHKTRRG